MKKLLVFFLSFILLGVINVQAEGTYNIKYNGNGNTSGEMAIQEGLLYSKRYTLSSNKFAKTGYSFNGWNKKTDGSGKSYDNKATISKLTTKDGGTVNLYAQWIPKEYTITYVLNGGKSNGGNPEIYTIETPTFLLKGAIRDGYTFVGWYKDSGLTSKVTKVINGTTGNRTMYAKWEVNEYSIKYNGNGNTSGEMSLQSNLIYNKSYTLSSNKFAKTGYSFNGWNKKVDGSGKSYDNKATISKLTTKDGGTVNLYAQWVPKEYTITYVLNGGTNDDSNPKTYTIETPTTILKSPTKEGYIFVGWYKDSGLTSKVTRVVNGSTGNRKLYAKWNPIKYTIAFDGNNATSGETPSQTNLLYNEEYQLSANKFKRDGYTFNGWNTKANGKGTKYSSKSIVSNLTNVNNGIVTLYAQWKPINYNITYKLYGGENDSSNPTTFNLESNITLKAPTKEGCIFQGWFQGYNFQHLTPITSISNGNLGIGDKMLFAGWLLEDPVVEIRNDEVGKTKIIIRKGGVASYYYIYKSKEGDNTSTQITPHSQSTSEALIYEDNDIIPGEKYYYKIQAVLALDDYSLYYSESRITSNYITYKSVTLPDTYSRNQSAVNKAKFYLEYYSNSRTELIDKLKNDGYTDEEAIYGVDNSDANWNQQVVKRANERVKIYNTRKTLNRVLYNAGFTEEEANYGVANCNTNWYENALDIALSRVRNGTYSRQRIINSLINNDYFTEEEAIYGVDGTNADWYYYAKQNAIDSLKYGAYSRQGLINRLMNVSLFTEEESIYAVDNIDVNWYQQALLKAQELLQNSSTGYTRSRLIEFLVNYDLFTNAEATYAADQLGL